MFAHFFLSSKSLDFDLFCAKLYWHSFCVQRTKYKIIKLNKIPVAYSCESLLQPVRHGRVLANSSMIVLIRTQIKSTALNIQLTKMNQSLNKEIINSDTVEKERNQIQIHSVVSRDISRS